MSDCKMIAFFIENRIDYDRFFSSDEYLLGR